MPFTLTGTCIQGGKLFLTSAATEQICRSVHELTISIRFSVSYQWSIPIKTVQPFWQLSDKKQDWQVWTPHVALLLPSVNKSKRTKWAERISSLSGWQACFSSFLIALDKRCIITYLMTLEKAVYWGKWIVFEAVLCLCFWILQAFGLEIIFCTHHCLVQIFLSKRSNKLSNDTDITWS